jgi:hypothetical protein
MNQMCMFIILFTILDKFTVALLNIGPPRYEFCRKMAWNCRTILDICPATDRPKRFNIYQGHGIHFLGRVCPDTTAAFVQHSHRFRADTLAYLARVQEWSGSRCTV